MRIRAFGLVALFHLAAIGGSLGGIVLLNTNERIGQMDYKRTVEAKAETKRRDDARKVKYGNGAKK